MSEETHAPAEPEAPSSAAPVSPSRFVVVKLAIALCLSAVAVAAIYRNATKDNAFQDPVAIQAAIDKADPVVKEDVKVEGDIRTRTITHKSGNVEIVTNAINPQKPPVPIPYTGPPKKSGGAPKKKMDEAKTKE